MLHRVVVTGMGTVSPVGNTLQENWNSILNGRSGISTINKFDTEKFPVKIAGEVNIDIAERLQDKNAKRLDPFIQYALIAAEEAIEHAGIRNKKDVGVVIGSGQGGISNIEKEHTKLSKGQLKRLTPYFIPSSVIGMAAGYVSSHFSFIGPNYGVTSACATSAHAIIDAVRMIALGEVDTVVTGGSEATITPLSLAGFSRLNALCLEENPLQASRPFDLNRSGFVSGEGAGILVLESYESAIKRNATIYGEIKGYGATSDAYHITAPCPEATGQATAMGKALAMAGVNPDQIDYINAHGTSTKLNDKIETKAIKKVFAESARSVSISSTKSMTGHLLGAAGVVETIYCLMSLHDNAIPPTINLNEQDPDCDLDYTPNKMKRKNVDWCLSNSFGFGGTNASLVLKKVA
ncbi:beta-ketoacyl-ACP synthase II [Pleionea sediminis]|uniref:beta-ketoacyl-ACP synthase II n=1 Tax=Pleionea sediminis TaxID=2569479 RepID=UPI001186D396|nr:beta-ketoacyl-ACP synthase II [Pleionea sediminis]